MKFWTTAEAAVHVKVPAAVADLADVTLDVLDRTGDGRVRFIRIGCSDGEFEDDRYQVDLEIAPGVVLPTMLGSVEGVDCGWDDPEDDKDNLAALLNSGLSCCLPILGELSDTVHDARSRARRVVAAWNAQGIPTRLIDVRLAPRDHWAEARKPSLLVTIEDLDDALDPAEIRISVEDAASLELELDAWKDHVRAAYDRRTTLASKGASGTIDQTALNAFAHFGDVADGIRRLRDEPRFWFADDTAITTLHGHVSTGSGVADAQVQLTGDYVTVSSTFVPAEQLRATIGRPATELLDHWFLSKETRILEASCEISEGMPMLTIKISNPKRLFCSVSGRVWNDVADDDDEALVQHERSGSVVPFRRRTA